MDICVVALGKIGLLAVQFAQAGHRVRGADIDQATVDSINQGNPFPGETGLEEGLQIARSSGLLRPPPTPPQLWPNPRSSWSWFPCSSTRKLGPTLGPWMPPRRHRRGLQPGTLVSYETTIPVHTTRDRFGVALETATGMTVGEDFYLCHSPERVFSGRIFADLRAYRSWSAGWTPSRLVERSRSTSLRSSSTSVLTSPGPTSLGSRFCRSG